MEHIETSTSKTFAWQNEDGLWLVASTGTTHTGTHVHVRWSGALKDASLGLIITQLSPLGRKLDGVKLVRVDVEVERSVRIVEAK